MSLAKVTYHDHKKAPLYPAGGIIGILPPMVGNRENVVFTGVAGYGAIQTRDVIVRILADADCGVAVIGAAPAAATLPASLPIKANVPQELLLPKGKRIGIIGEA